MIGVTHGRDRDYAAALEFSQSRAACRLNEEADLAGLAPWLHSGMAP